jgi:hypothetical protein
MNAELKTYHKFLSVISIHVCLWILLVHAWMGYATVTERPGIRYMVYKFQGLTKLEFTCYNFTVAFLALQFIAFQVYYLVEKKANRLMYTFVGVILLGIII